MDRKRKKLSLAKVKKSDVINTVDISNKLEDVEDAKCASTEEDVDPRRARSDDGKSKAGDIRLKNDKCDSSLRKLREYLYRCLESADAAEPYTPLPLLSLPLKSNKTEEDKKLQQSIDSNYTPLPKLKMKVWTKSPLKLTHNILEGYNLESEATVINLAKTQTYPDLIKETSAKNMVYTGPVSANQDRKLALNNPDTTELQPGRVHLSSHADSKQDEGLSTDSHGISTATSESTNTAVLNNCPLCQMQFPQGMSQLEMDGHIAACLAQSGDDAAW